MLCLNVLRGVRSLRRREITVLNILMMMLKLIGGKSRTTVPVSAMSSPPIRGSMTNSASVTCDLPVAHSNSNSIELLSS